MNDTNEFSTRRLQLAVFLHATGLLPYLRTEPHADGKLRFVFSDEKHQGRQFELDFERGGTVVARDVFSSQTFMRREMDDQKIGDRENDFTRR